MKQLLFHPILLVLYTVLMVAGVVSLNQTVGEIEQSAETIHVLDEEINQIESEVVKLEQELAMAESDLTKEKIIRDELLMQKPGEYVLQLPPLPSPSPEVVVVEEKTPAEEWSDLIWE